MPGFDRFLQVFASAGPINPPTDQQAALGWDYIGAAPPTVQQHNAVFQWLDEKDNWLFGQLARVLITAGITPGPNPDTQLLNALQLLFGNPDISYLYNSINEVVSNAGFSPNNSNPLLWDAILSAFATKAEVSARVLRSGDDMQGPFNVMAPSGPWNAAPKAYVDGTNGFGGTGYKIFPGGFIVQWGVVGKADRVLSTSVYVPFPTGFPNWCASVNCTIEYDNPGLMDMAPALGNYNQFGATLVAGVTLGDEGTMIRNFGWHWIAVGW